MSGSTTIINNIEGAIAALHRDMDSEDSEDEREELIQQLENNIEQGTDSEEAHALTDAGTRKQAKDEYIDSGT
jgi:hypothetical protein